MIAVERQVPGRLPLPDDSSAFQSGVVLNINKPEGWTSFDVVKKIRGTVHVKKVGHAGTLDPFATGVLLVCTGKATKRVPELMGTEKVYEAVVELGRATDTYDRTGTVVAEADSSHVTGDDVQRLLHDFTGDILQVPPMYSALKMNGKRLYEMAREGVIVERPPRNVTVHAIELLDVDLPRFTIRVRCSKGTYIRSLAHDMGQVFGTGGHLAELVRTQVGNYKLDHAWSIREFVRAYNVS